MKIEFNQEFNIEIVDECSTDNFKVTKITIDANQTIIETNLTTKAEEVEVYFDDKDSPEQHFFGCTAHIEFKFNNKYVFDAIAHQLEYIECIDVIPTITDFTIVDWKPLQANHASISELSKNWLPVIDDFISNSKIYLKLSK